MDCGPPLRRTVLRVRSPALLQASLLPTTLGPPLQLRPHGHQASRSLFHMSVAPLCQSPVVVLHPDTLRWCCSASSWCIALGYLLEGRRRTTSLPGRAQASSLSASWDGLAVALETWCSREYRTVSSRRKSAVCRHEQLTSMDLQHLWSLAHSAVSRHTVARHHPAYPRAHEARSYPSSPLRLTSCRAGKQH